MTPAAGARATAPEAASLMAREIREIPEVVARLLDLADGELAAVAGVIDRFRPRWVTLAGRGTSDHAATYGRYLFETQLGLPAGLAAPSVATLYEARLDWRDRLLVCVSQSGRSPDVVAICEAARAGGALTVAVLNDAGSPLARVAELVIDVRAGVENSVAATKTYVAQLAALAALVTRLRPEAGLAALLERLPQLLQACLDAGERWLAGSSVVDEFARADRALVCSRGHNLATALEISLKLKETSGIFADGYSMADLLHGPVVLARDEVPLLAIRPPGALGRSLDDGLRRLRSVGGRPWVIGGPAPEGQAGERSLDLPIGDLPEPLSPLACVLPGQLLAEAVARVRGLDPDRPAGLSKVTLTR